MPSQITPQEALIYAMITTAAVDRKLGDDELSRIGSIVSQLPAFKDYSHDWLVREAEECGKVLGQTDGLHDVLDLIEASLPEHLRETAYALSVDVAATDLKVKAEEIRFLELLAMKLDLDKLTCAAIERGARARHQKA